MTPAEEARWDAAAARHDAGMDLLEQGALAEATAEVRSALADLTELLGDAHPEVGHVRVSCGMTAVAIGKLAEAREDIEAGLAVLDAWDDAAGAPLRIRGRIAYGDLLRQLGEYDAAVATLRAVSAETAALAPDDPLVANAWNALGIALRFVADFAGSAEAYAHALRCSSGNDPAAISARATVLHNLAGLAHGHEDIAAGEAYIREALALRAQIGASAGADAALDSGLLAAIVSEAGRTDEALALFAEAAAAIAATFPAAHPEQAYLAHNWGDALAGADRLTDAEAAYRRAIAGKVVALGAAHPEVALSQARLASVLSRAGRQDEAEVLVRTARTTVCASLAADHPFHRTIERVAGEILGVSGVD